MSPKQTKGNNFAKNSERSRTFYTVYRDSGDLYNAERWQGSCDKRFRLSRVAQRFVQEHEKQSYTLGIKNQRGQNGRSLNALSHEQLGSCAEFIEANMEFARKKAWDLHKNMKNVKRTHVQILPTAEQNNTKESCRISVRL